MDLRADMPPTRIADRLDILAPSLNSEPILYGARIITHFTIEKFKLIDKIFFIALEIIYFTKP